MKMCTSKVVDVNILIDRIGLVAQLQLTVYNRFAVELNRTRQIKASLPFY